MIKPINTAWTPVAIGLAAVLLPVGWALLRGVSFTINGYDVDGGTDPICWKLHWLPSTQHLKLQNFRMMPACYPGTGIYITPLDLDNDETVQVMHTNKTYAFRLEASLDLTVIARDLKKDLPGFTGTVVTGNRTSRHVLFRIILCDISKIGFCNPLSVSFLEQNEDEQQDYDQLTADGWLANTTGDEVVQAAQIGNHVFSPWLNMTLEEVGPNNYSTSKTVRMQLPPGQRGSFFVIGHAHFQAHFVTNNRTDEWIDAMQWMLQQLNQSDPTPTAIRTTEVGNQTANFTADDVVVWVESADAVANNVVDVRPPPDIMRVTDAMVGGVAVVSALAAAFSFAIFVFIVVHRNHMVMKLAQWRFLLWMVWCCLFSNVFLFTYLPTKTWHCRFNSMLQLIPLTMNGCILVGRSWRVYLTLSAAMNIGIRRNSNTRTQASSYVKKYCVGVLTLIAQFPYNLRRSKEKEEVQRPSKGGFRKKVTAAETTRLILWVCLPQIIIQVTGAIIYDKHIAQDINESQTEGRELCSNDGAWTRRLGVGLVAAAYATAVLLAWICRDLPSAFNETDGIFQAATINTIVGLMALSLDQIADISGTPPDIYVFLWAATSLIVSSTTIGFIVMPKVNRVRSGEEIILSNLLAQTGESTQHGLGAPKPSSHHINAQNRSIYLKKDDPIPKGLERNLLGVNELVGGVRNKLAEGRTPNLKEWDQLIGKVDELHATFERVEFEWTEEDEERDS